MKKTIITVIIILIVGTFSYVGWFSYTYLRGIGPAVKGPVGDIVQIIEDHNNEQKDEELSPAINNTDFPLVLPQGFEISIFADNVPGARVMAFDSQGNLWVSQTNEGTVTEFEVENGEVVGRTVVLKDLNKPHGLVFDPQDPQYLYVAEEDKVIKVSLYTIGDVVTEKVIDLPTGGRHTTRSLYFGPDEDTLLVSIGSSCDVCQEEDVARRASIIAVDLETGGWQTYAIGLRNSVFMTTHPVTGQIWATEMGRDFLGDNLPPDEINIIKQRKLNSNDLPGYYGWPLCYGQNVHDEVYDSDDYVSGYAPCENMVPSHIDLPAHVAPLGLAFIPEEGWPEDMWYDLLVAYHGSWNSTDPVGYKIVRFSLDEHGDYGYAPAPGIDFVSGWLTDEGALGRPVDIITQPGGVMYVSDDKAGVIYKISYIGSSQNNTSTTSSQAVELKKLSSQDAGSSILNTYELCYAEGGVCQELNSYRELELSPGNHFIALEADPDYAISFFDVDNHSFIENKVPLEISETGNYPDVGRFVWSPDGKHVAFSTADGTLNTQLYMYHVDTYTHDVLSVDAFDVCGSSCYAETPVWSPDGMYVALLHYDRDDGGSKINYRIITYDPFGYSYQTIRLDQDIIDEDVKIVWNDGAAPSYYISD